jgi:hypothetical protein
VSIDFLRSFVLMLVVAGIVVAIYLAIALQRRR